MRAGLDNHRMTRIIPEADKQRHAYPGTGPECWRLVFGMHNEESVVVYSTQHRGLLETDQRSAGVDSNSPDVVPNADGSYTVYFGPTAPPGKEANWVQTVPGKGWCVLFRLYGPLEPWFDRTWKPGDIELVK